MNDVSARALQMRGGQWTKGKAIDTFAPLGPYLVTGDEVGDPHQLRIQLELNGRIMQDSRTDQLIFKIPQLIAFLSELFTLEPGDIISTGTPPGVGFVRKPPVFLKPGDQVSVIIDKIGRLTNSVV
jgi:2-keto-4-pentenoate hydratase/2-oxohepta-3-ene-1,7-dioic acid hydratase in catechol pathway